MIDELTWTGTLSVVKLIYSTRSQKQKNKKNKLKQTYASAKGGATIFKVGSASEKIFLTPHIWLTWGGA